MGGRRARFRIRWIYIRMEGLINGPFVWDGVPTTIENAT